MINDWLVEPGIGRLGRPGDLHGGAEEVELRQSAGREVLRGLEQAKAQERHFFWRPQHGTRACDHARARHTFSAFFIDATNRG
jgi:hypothetical protein